VGPAQTKLHFFKYVHEHDRELEAKIFDFLDTSRWQLAEHNLRQRKLGVEERQEVDLIRKDGTHVWIIGSANPVFDRNGQYAGALALLGDLSPQKEREQLLEKEIDHLRTQLSQRPGSSERPRTSAPSDQPPGFQEPFRTAVVLGVLGTLFATIAVTTLGAVVTSVFGNSDSPPSDL
jgi:PAS domain S-box-containing protein